MSATATNPNVPTVEQLKAMKINEIALLIYDDHKRQGKKVWFGAVPYLEAMTSLSEITDNYGLDSGRSIVSYFLANGQQWKGEVAKAIKAELKRRTK